jgi:hypothetical protein
MRLHLLQVRILLDLEAQLQDLRGQTIDLIHPQDPSPRQALMQRRMPLVSLSLCTCTVVQWSQAQAATPNS